MKKELKAHLFQRNENSGSFKSDLNELFVSVNTSLTRTFCRYQVLHACSCAVCCVLCAVYVFNLFTSKFLRCAVIFMWHIAYTFCFSKYLQCIKVKCERRTYISFSKNLTNQRWKCSRFSSDSSTFRRRNLHAHAKKRSIISHDFGSLLLFHRWLIQSLIFINKCCCSFLFPFRSSVFTLFTASHGNYNIWPLYYMVFDG